MVFRISCRFGITDATIGDYAGNGLDGGKNFLSGFPASASGSAPDQGAAFAGINPLVAENEMLFPIGRSVYTGLETKLVQRVANLPGGLKNGSFQVSYALSRFNSMTGDQDFVNSSFDFRNPTHYFGPSSLDRTHQLSFGGSFELPHGPKLSFVSHFFSPLANNLAASFQFRPAKASSRTTSATALLPPIFCRDSNSVHGAET